MPNGNFRRALLDVDRDLASVPFSSKRDVRSIISARRRTPWRLPALALAAAIVILLLTRARDREPALIAGFKIDAPQSSWRIRGSEVEVIAPTLDLDVPGFGHIVAARGARVAPIDGGIHVVGGHVEVDVIHRPRGVAPALVRVSHGMIAVIGTRFTIEQLEHGGRVLLHEGRIRFDAGDRSVVLEPGSSLTWPLAKLANTPPLPPSGATSAEVAPPPGVPPPPAVSPPAVAPPTAVAPAAVVPPRRVAPPREPARVNIDAAEPPQMPAIVPTTPAHTATPATPPLDTDRVIADVANLRARRRFADAAALLEQTLTGDLPIATLERLSYELGDIETYQLANPERACRHWRLHRARFLQGRYTDEVDAAVRRLACEETRP